MRLRTKFLLSLVLVTTALSGATLIMVRVDAQERMQREIRQDAANAIVRFQVVQNQRRAALSRKADLLASLALMRNGDATTIKDVSDDPWQSGDCDLYVLANSQSQIVALRSSVSEVPTDAAADTLRQSIKQGKSDGWWFSGRRLYQIVLQRFYEGQPGKGALLGTVIVGRGIDPTANDLKSISSGQLAFRYGSEIVASSLSSEQQLSLADQLRAQTPDNQIYLDNERFFASNADLNAGSSPAISVTVLKSYSEGLGSLRTLNRRLIELGLFAVAAGAILVFLISDRFINPIASLMAGVQALEQGNYNFPIESKGADEVAHLTRAFDRMRDTLRCAELEHQELEGQLRQSQKMEAVGRLAGGVAHDFNNLLTVIKGHGDLAIDRLNPEDPVHRSVRQIDAAADKAASLTRQLLAFCRMQVLQPRVIDVNGLIGEMSSLLKRLIREDIDFSFDPGEPLGRVKADPGQIEQVVMNLVVNARDAMPQGGKVAVKTRNVRVTPALARMRPPMVPGEYVLISVADTGHGMDADTKSHIFEPFFTTKEQGKGTGLGLATVYGVVKQSNGCIWVESELGKGARFEVYLPLVAAADEKPSIDQIIAKPKRHTETVLLVEDEFEVQELATEFLKASGFSVLAAENGEEALAIAKASRQPIHVLLTDVVMPTMRGPELAKRLKSLRPEVRIVYMSGYLEYNPNSGEFLEDSFFLQKPFTRVSLISKVIEALKKEQPVS